MLGGGNVFSVCSSRVNPCSSCKGGGPGGAICPLSPWTRLSLDLSPTLSFVPSSIPAEIFSLARPSLLSHHCSAVGLGPAATTPSRSRACTRVPVRSHMAPVHTHIASKECAFWVETVSSEKYFVFSFVHIPQMKNES